MFVNSDTSQIVGTTTSYVGLADREPPQKWGSSVSGSPTLKYDPSVLPQGVNNLEVTASDPIGHVSSEGGSPSIARVKVDHTAPTISLSGTMTNQAALGTTLPQYILSYEASDGTSEAPQSGIAKTEVLVDGTKVQSSSAGCATENCKVTNSWTLQSSSYAVGKHTVVVKARDAVGLESKKELQIEIARDTTQPSLTVSGGLASAPEGWVEQKSYLLIGQGSDPKGYGVTSLIVTIDGNVVKSVTTPCPAGSCDASTFSSVNMAGYSGGEHLTEVVATDGAGNTAKKIWTLNVNPKGEVPASEVIDTLEAVDTTGGTITVAPTSEVIDPAEINAGNNPAISGLKSTGTAASSTIAPSPVAGFEIEMPKGEAVSIVPTVTSQTATSVVIAGGVSGVAANTRAGVDSVVRPIFDGSMVFQSIRESTSPEEFSWKVKLESDQIMSLYDEHTAQVFYDDGTPAMLIKAEEAHDAIGKEVPTSLSVSGNIITLKVTHKGGGFVYPIVAGPEFQTGYNVPEIIPPPESPGGLLALEVQVQRDLMVGPPEPVPTNEAEASISSAREKRRTFAETICGHKAQAYEGFPGALAPYASCGNAFTEDAGVMVVWHGTMRGAFLYTPETLVRQKAAIACAKGTPEESLAYDWAIQDAYECHYGPKTTDGNGGVHASGGHYLRAQAHWTLGVRGNCRDECSPNPWIWDYDRPLELHLWPSGAVERVVP